MPVMKVVAFINRMSGGQLGAKVRRMIRLLVLNLVLNANPCSSRRSSRPSPQSRLFMTSVGGAQSAKIAKAL